MSDKQEDIISQVLKASTERNQVFRAPESWRDHCNSHHNLLLIGLVDLVI